MNRNPYVILGIPFGASRAEANVAFAGKARSLRRRGREGIDQLTDLTWALQQIDEAIRNPAAAMELYRIPADPEAFKAPGEGVLQPPPERLAARPGDRGGALTALQQAAARQYLRYLVTLRAAEVSVPQP
jgi:hypothetical protein